MISIILILAIAILIYKVWNYDPERWPSSDEEPSSYGKPLSLRQNYYRNDYLKSEAWQRKRYVVLRRDNWRCQYCGGRATQVHHTKYLKRNLGKEPIEWLVSICKNCHDAIHNHPNQMKLHICFPR